LEQESISSFSPKEEFEFLILIAEQKPPISGRTSMFYFKLNKIYIDKNREDGFLFERDEAEVELWSIVATNNTSLPSMGDFLAANSTSQRREIAKMLVQDFIALKEVNQIDHVKDDHEMLFGNTGYVIYQSEQVPDDLNWNLIAIDIDQEERDRGELIEALVDTPEFDELTTKLESVTAAVPNPTFRAAVAVGNFVAKGITKKLQRSGDDLIGCLLMSLNRQEHYQNGKRKEKDVPDLTENMKVDYALYTTDA
jgi:hypothetical protein